MTERRDSGIKNELTRRIDLSDIVEGLPRGLATVAPGFRKVEVTVFDSGIVGIVSLPQAVVGLYKTNRAAFDEALEQALESVKNDLLESARKENLDT